MSEQRQARGLDEALIEELINALQSALLLSKGFERALCDTAWAQEAVDLHAAVTRAAKAVADLRRRAAPERGPIVH